MTTNQSDTFEIGESTVHRLGFGAMRICGDDIIGAPEDEAAARELLREVVDLGVDFIDTADAYGPGTNERLIREALHPDEGATGDSRPGADKGATGDGRPGADQSATGDGRPGAYGDAFVATKGGILRNPDGGWLPHGDPDYLRNACLASLDRLGVDSIDLYQLHRPDPDTEFEASVTTLAELKDDGLVENVGLSNVSVAQLETARDHVDIATVQNEYNLANPEHADVLAACEDADIGFIPYFPIGAGDLGEKAAVIDEVAERHDASGYQVALAWLLGHSNVTLPIPGTSSIEHLRENVAASELELSGDEIARLSE
ncbi:MAG: aldo/keto reductase [Haloarcula sp.]